MITPDPRLGQPVVILKTVMVSPTVIPMPTIANQPSAGVGTIEPRPVQSEVVPQPNMGPPYSPAFNATGLPYNPEPTVASLKNEISWLSLTLQQLSKTLQQPVDQTTAQLPAHAAKIMDELKRLGRT
jgi:hypothetical protein